MRSKADASEKFKAWRECRSLLEQRTSALQAEMEEFLAGESAMPEALLAEVLALQKKCLALFEQLVAT